MAKNMKLQAFPEEITEDGLKIYGETSFENQMAVLSHYLHNNEVKVTRKQKEEIERLNNVINSTTYEKNIERLSKKLKRKRRLILFLYIITFVLLLSCLFLAL